jgi:hypothetical protein
MIDRLKALVAVSKWKLVLPKISFVYERCHQALRSQLYLVAEANSVYSRGAEDAATLRGAGNL